jgi:hypothetical protein
VSPEINTCIYGQAIFLKVLNHLMGGNDDMLNTGAEKTGWPHAKTLLFPTSYAELLQNESEVYKILVDA